MIIKGVHGGHGFGSRNLERELQLKFADAVNMAVANTWFTRDRRKLVTYESGGCRTVVDYMLIRQDDRKIVRNVGVICGECCLPQHNLLLCALAWRDEVDRKEEVFVSQTSMETEKGRSS